MEGVGTLHLLFMNAELYYLLPVSAVDKISDGRGEADDLSVINFFELTADRSRMQSAVNTYIIEINHNGECFGLSVQSVIGLRNIEPEGQILLKEPVLNSRNQYLKAAVWLEEEQAWAYLLDSSQLNRSEQRADISEDKKCQIPITSDSIDSEELEFIVIEYGGRPFYADKSKAEGIVTNPQIQRVPGAFEYIIGISAYESQMIIYYNLMKSPTEETTDHPCGIIMKGRNGSFFGVWGSITGEYHGILKEAECLAEGIWEIHCD